MAVITEIAPDIYRVSIFAESGQSAVQPFSGERR